MTDQVTSLPLIGQPAPQFTAASTTGEINFPDDYKGKWVVLFSHPADFTPVCTTEFLGFQALHSEFQALNTELVGYSVDGLQSHIEWVRNIKKNFGVDIEFPIAAGPEIAHKYGMLHTVDSTHTVRAVFLINPEGLVHAIMYYPLANGRDIHEILRLVKAAQKSYEGVATPEKWPNNARFGSKVIVPPAPTVQAAVENESNSDYECVDWYLCLKEDE